MRYFGSSRTMAAGRTQPMQLKLPANYQQDSFFKFHARDKDAVAERVTRPVMQKGLMWRGEPVVAEISLVDGTAHCRLQQQAEADSLDQASAQLFHRLLGLVIDIDAFESALSSHALLGNLIRRQTGLRIMMMATPFEALTWAVTGQQINLSVALKLRSRLIELAGQQYAGDLYCYPDAASLVRVSQQQLASAGFSVAKARTLLEVSRMVCDGELCLDIILDSDEIIEQMRAQLLAIRGIGPWTVNYMLLRGFGCADASLHGDVAVRNGLQRLLGQQNKVTIAEAETWLRQFSPWRAMVAAHLWALQTISA